MTSPPADVVQRQLDAYNARNIEQFMLQFSEQIEIFELGAPSPTTTGKASVRNLYSTLFANSPMLHAHLVNRTVLGRTVVDHERIDGRMGSREPIELLMIYEVLDGLIRRCHVVRT